jgi:peptidoglycan/xylan/chitin deacetylase (PgdA/CDA1 family)
VGSNAKRYPGLMSKMIQEGHGVGNHTMRHEKAGMTSKKAYLASIYEASNYIDSKLFRPPYGRLPIGYVRSIKKSYEIIMWSWLSYNFDVDVTAEYILEKARSQIKPGHILVLHDNLKVKDKLAFFCLN